MSAKSPDDFHSIEKWHTVLQNVYIEFFATLLPGMLYVAAMVLIVIVFCCATGHKDIILWILDYCAKSKTKFYSLGLLVYFALSYISGAIAYRRSPNYPDLFGAYAHYLRHKPAEGSKNTAMINFRVRKPKKKYFKRVVWKMLCCWGENPFNETCTFPYPDVRDYLFDHEWCNLCQFVTWNGDKKTRHNINIIKQIIRMVAKPDVIFEVVRNESHIRMMSSVWYEILNIRLASVLLVLFALLINNWTLVVDLNNFISHSYEFGLLEIITESISRIFKCFSFFAFVLCVLYFGFLSYVLREIEYGIHNMRERELIMILEYAYLLDRESNPDCVANRRTLEGCLCRNHNKYMDEMAPIDWFERVRDDAAVVCPVIGCRTGGWRWFEAQRLVRI